MLTSPEIYLSNFFFHYSHGLSLIAVYVFMNFVLEPQSYYNNNIEGACNLNIYFIYEATPSYLKSYLLQVTSIVLKLQLL